MNREYKSKKKSLLKEVDADSLRIQNIRRQLGKYIYMNHSGDIESRTFSALIDRTSKIGRDIPENKKQIENIKKWTEEIKVLKGDIKLARDEIERTVAEGKLILEKIGTSAYIVFKKNSENQDIPQFVEISAVLKEMEEIQSQIDEIGSNDSKALLKQITSGGRMVYLNAALVLKKKALHDLYGALGQYLYETGSIDKNADKKILAAAAPFLEGLERIDILKRKEESARNKIGKNKLELSKKGAIKKYEKKYDDLTLALQENYSKIGAAYEKKPVEALKNDKEIGKLIDQLSTIKKQSETNKKMAVRLEAAIEAEKLKKETAKIKKTIAELEAKISACKKVAGKNENRIRSLEKIHGNLKIPGN